MIKHNILKLALIALLLVGVTTISATAQSEFLYLIDISDTRFLPETIHSGDLVSLIVDVKNRGSGLVIENLNATLDIGSQFEAIDLNDTVDRINGGATHSLTFKFRASQDIPPSYYPVFLTMSYTRRGDLVTERKTILIPVSKVEKNIDIRLAPKVINPGNQTEFTFTLKNVGGAISNIEFSWDEVNDLILPLGSDNKRYLQALQPSQEAEIEYIVAADPNITPGIYPLDITMTYTDENGTQTQTSEVGIIIGGATDFEVSAEILNTGQLSLSIANIGSNNAGAMVVRIPQQQNIRVAGSNIAILGNLNRGDFTLANFNVALTSADQNAATGFRGGFRGDNRQGQSPDRAAGFGSELLVEIDYTDTTGERKTVQKQIQLSLGSRDTIADNLGQGFRQQTGLFSFIPWVLLLLAIGVGALYYRAKAKNKDWKKLAKVLGASTVLFLATIFLLNGNLLVSVIIGLATVVAVVHFSKKIK